MYFLGNALLFLGALGVQFGLLDTGSDDTTDDASPPEEAPVVADVPDPEDPATIVPVEFPEEAPEYVAADYAQETVGTAEGDLVVAAAGEPNQAFLLQDGNDTLNGSFGNDFADAGAGDDTLLMRGGDDIVAAGAGNDTVDGGLGDDSLFGGADDDLMTGGKGDDLLAGGLGNDTLSGSDGNDVLLGGRGDDVLFGHLSGLQEDPADGNDTLLGGAGNDTLHVAGGDEATGGDGADSFVLYDPADSGTTALIEDFDAAEDVIGLVYSPELDPLTDQPVDPVIALTPTADGTGAVLSVNGIPVGTITGGQSLTPGDIALIPA